METLRVPLINPGDYETFRRILHGDIPKTYDEWGQLHMKEVFGTRGQGHECREVKVFPEEFARHYKALGTRCSYQDLRDFALKKSGL